MRDHINDVLRRASQILDPLLTDKLRPASCCDIELIFSIHDGNLNHVKEGVVDRFVEQPGSYSTSLPIEKRVAVILGQCGTVLRPKLETSFRAGWHGQVVLSVTIEGGDCKMVTCGYGRTHKERAVG